MAERTAAMDVAATQAASLLATIRTLAISIADAAEIATAWDLAEGILALAERGKQVLDDGMESDPSEHQQEPSTAAPGVANGAQAAQLANEMANACLMADQHCAWTHGGFDKDCPADQVNAELQVLRDTINRLGWMADRTSELLGGEICKGSADKWLLSPAFNDVAKGGAA